MLAEMLLVDDRMEREECGKTSCASVLSVSTWSSLVSAGCYTESAAAE